MTIGKYHLTQTQVWLSGLTILFIAYIIFNELRKASWKSKLESDLAAIDKRMSSGRASAGELVDLRLRRKATLQQYLNTI